MTTGQDLKENTIKAYNREIDRFKSDFEERFQRRPDAVSLNEIASYMQDCAADRSRTAFYQHAAAVKYWCAQARGESLELQSFLPAPPPAKTRIMSKSDLSLLFEKARGHVCGLMMQMIYGTGIRLHEIIQLRVQAFDEGAMEITIHRGMSTRQIRVPERLRYPVIREAAGKGASDYLFSLRESSNRILPVARRSLQFYISEVSVSAGLGRITVQMLRDAYAVHSLESGADPRLVARSMGFRSVHSVQKYRTLVPDAKRTFHGPLGMLENPRASD